MLTQFQGGGTSLQLLQNSWATQLNPVLANPLVNGILLKNVQIVGGNNSINHKLGRKPQGWIICGIDQACFILNSNAQNSMPDKILILDAVFYFCGVNLANLDLYVF